MYVSTNINPADITTRLLSPNTFVSCKLWWEGPDFLQFKSIDMLCQSFLRPVEVSEEQKAETVLFAGSEKAFGIGEVMDNSRFRSLQKLLCVTCYVRCFVENLKVILGKVGNFFSEEISAEEMDSGIKLWIKHEQLLLRTETNFTKVKHSLRLFFAVENLLRCRTRISSNETLNYGMQFFILLQRSSNFTKLITLHHHDKVYHCGIEATLNHIRNF